MPRPHRPPSSAAVSDEALSGEESACYARHRPGLPDAAVRLPATAQHGVTAPVLLDLGTGTGQVPLALLPVLRRLTHIHLVDVSRRMPEHALRARTPVRGTCTVTGFVGAAHTYAPAVPDRARSLVTCCRSFHWMDRPAVLAMAARVAASHAVVAVMGDGSLWTCDAEWTAALRDLIRSRLGTARRAGTHGTYTEPGRSFRDELAASAFGEVTRHAFPVVRNRTPEDVIGYLRTTSFARPALLADRHQQFEADARRLLRAHAHDGVLREEAVSEVLLARRTAGAV
ncbi:class I SAM-dependent methyltransferase [Streptomyces sp. UH6]|uniref:class I SAM-dependent methyltransferase n=1 Tax=Streptomyces sp. UH6 TaxID=2748379 RepID=UPI0015D4BF46|nr:class I SAM-dependent methyltransferase [Streptomyces sp. UH6]NYV75326.1 class I SAM-dependent methyltransferase [Streptomyces sp. UH6]